MEHSTGTIFLSHSSADKDFVEEISEKLPKSHIFYDTETIYPGEDNTHAIEQALENTDVFVLFLSPSTLEREFVVYETNLAKAARIRRDYLRIIVVPIKGASYRDAPVWMRKYQTVTNDYTKNDIARAIWNAYQEIFDKKFPEKKRNFVGREDTIHECSIRFHSKLRDTGQFINVVHFAGIEQMGRLALSRRLINELYPSANPVPAVFLLNDNADSLELYMALYEDLHGEASISDLSDVMNEFRQKAETEKGTKIYEILSHYGKLNQVVIIKCAMGIRDKGKTEKIWVGSLLNSLIGDNETKIFWISERKLPQETISDHPNLIEFDVSSINDTHMEYLLTSLIDSNKIVSSEIKKLSSLLNGHPGTAYYVSSIINSNNTSMPALIDNNNTIVTYQSKYLKKTIDGFSKNSIEYAILYWLMVLPHCDYISLKKILSFSNFTGETHENLSSLSDYCLVYFDASVGYYIPNIVKSIIRHNIDDHDPKLVSALRQLIQFGVDDAELRLSYIDMLIHIYAFLGEDIPEALRGILTSSTLQEIVHDNFQNGLNCTTKESISFFETAAKYANLAFQLEASDDVVEDIMLNGAEAIVRCGREPENFLVEMKKRGFQSVHLVVGNNEYFNKRNLRKAASEYRLAFNANVYRRRSGRRAARTYLQIGEPDIALDILNKIGTSVVNRDSDLLNIKIRSLVALRRSDEANDIRRIAQEVPDDFGYEELEIISSSIRYKRNFHEALQACKRYRNKPKSNKLNSIFIEATINIELGNIDEVHEAINLAKNTGRQNDYNSLMSRKLLKEGDLEEALQFIEKVNPHNLYDKLLFIEICKGLLDSDNYSSQHSVIKNKMNAVAITIQREPDEIVRY